MSANDVNVGEPVVGSRWASAAISALGGLLGGLVGAVFVVALMLELKTSMELVAEQTTWVIIVVPLIGLALAVLVLEGIGRTETAETVETLAPGTKAPRESRRGDAWRSFAPGSIRADITGDVVDTAGVEERFPWRQVPIRAVAIMSNVGLGAPLGTEAPAAYLGVGVGACLGDRGRRWRRLLRPAAVGGGAAGVAALMGIALVGTCYMLELGRRHRAPLSAERVIAAVIGGLVGWGINVGFGLDLIRLIVPEVAPRDFAQAVKTALFIGLISGGITALAGTAIYRAKKWRAAPRVRLVLGGLAVAGSVSALLVIAGPAAAVGPGGGAILWAENTVPLPMVLLAVALLRATATTAGVAAGGCGGIFVPFLAIGDIGGRVFAPSLDVGTDLAGAAGAAGGIAGGYRLPVTAVAMVFGLGGPRVATVTCVAAVVVAAVAGSAAGKIVDRVTKLPYPWQRRRLHAAHT